MMRFAREFVSHGTVLCGAEVGQGRTASAAAAAVGYESASQFSREFKRLFGRSPGAEVARLQASFAMPPLPGELPWVSSH